MQLEVCCGRFHEGVAPPTAVELMRARYAAYVVGDVEFLLRTWDPSTRPESLDLDAAQEWKGLQIVETKAGTMFDQEGTVTFAATFRAGPVTRQLQERSRFHRVDGKWVYVDAEFADLVDVDA